MRQSLHNNWSGVLEDVEIMRDKTEGCSGLSLWRKETHRQCLTGCFLSQNTMLLR